MYTKLKSFWKTPTKTFELILKKDISWLKTILFFSCNGILFMNYLMKSKGLIKVDSIKLTLISILFMISTGIIYGLFSNFIIGFLIQITGKIFNGENDLKKIYNVIGWSYLPISISVSLLIINILLAGVLTLEINSFLQLILSLIVGLFTIAQGGLAIWQFILLYKGLKVAQKLSTTDTILNYLLGTVIFGVFYYLLLYPHL